MLDEEAAARFSTAAALATQRKHKQLRDDATTPAAEPPLVGAPVTLVQAVEP